MPDGKVPVRASRYRADIDGMRAIAVAAVVVYHAFPDTLRCGFLGVDMFFVISGFLITGVISDDLRTGNFSIASFYARRVRRIAPALIVVLIASFGLGWHLMLPIDYRQFGAHMIGGSLFFSNVQFWLETGYFDKAANSKPLLHLWSLSVEEQFYLVWPLLLTWLAAKRMTPMRAAVGIAILSFAAKIALARQDPSAAFYLPFARFWELMLGAIVALSYRYHPGAAGVFVRDKPTWVVVASALCLGLVIVSLSVGNQDGSVTSWWPLLPTGGTAFLIFTGLNNRFSRTVLGAPGMVMLGAISYPLYLWHWPLLVFLRTASQGEVSAWSRLAVISLSIGLAWLTYVGIERPVRFGRYRTRLVLILCTSLVGVSLIGFVDYLGNGLAFRIPDPLRDYVSKQYDYSAGARVGRCWLSANAAYDGFDPTCFQGQETGKKMS